MYTRTFYLKYLNSCRSFWWCVYIQLRGKYFRWTAHTHQWWILLCHQLPCIKYHQGWGIGSSFRGIYTSHIVWNYFSLYWCWFHHRWNQCLYLVWNKIIFWIWSCHVDVCTTRMMHIIFQWHRVRWRTNLFQWMGYHFWSYHWW